MAAALACVSSSAEAYLQHYLIFATGQTNAFVPDVDLPLLHDAEGTPEDVLFRV